MKSRFLSSLAAAALLMGGAGQLACAWQPDSNPFYAITNIPIDATGVSIPQGYSFFFNGEVSFDTSDTAYFTNRGYMSLSPGANLWNMPAGEGEQRASSVFANVGDGLTGGIITCSSAQYTGGNVLILQSGGVLGSSGYSVVNVWADNLTNSGLITTGGSSVIQLKGKDVDLSRGAVTMTNSSYNYYLTTTNGIFFLSTITAADVLDSYWGVAGGTNLLVPTTLLNGLSPLETVYTRSGNINFGQVVQPTQIVYSKSTVDQVASNSFNQIVLLYNADPRITNYVFFDASNGTTVEWNWLSTNVANGQIAVHYLNLQDTFGVQSNLQYIQNGNNGPNPTYRPINYFFSEGAPYGPISSATQPTQATNVLPFAVATNDNTSYQVILSQSSTLPTDVPHGNITNQPGRLQIYASDSLNLSNTTLAASSYMLIQATNEFVGSPGAVISSPYLDLFLHRTNGQFWVTNLAAPYVEHASGTISLWSARWTNVDQTGMTNLYHVLMVASDFTPTTTPILSNCKLSVVDPAGTPGDLFISDTLNVSGNFEFAARTLTLTTNTSGGINPCGQLNLYNSGTVWPAMTPVLAYLTNLGYISASNEIYFGGNMSSGYSDQTGLGNSKAYDAFVNHGSVVDYGSHIWAHYLENGGQFLATNGGGFQLQGGEAAILTNGVISAPYGPISLGVSKLQVENHLLVSGGLLNLTVTNMLSDGVPNLALLPVNTPTAPILSNANTWVAGAGVQFTHPTELGDLLGTTIYCPATSQQQVVPMLWAANDYTNDNRGYFNNAALGRLILDASDSRNVFYFSNAIANSNCALYVDSIELMGAMTNVDASGMRSGLQVAPNMRVYFAQATANGVSIAEKLSLQTGGGFFWMSNYNYGYFSSTLVTNNGVTNRVNLPRLQSRVLPQLTNVEAWTPSGTNVWTVSWMATQRSAPTNSAPGTNGSGSSNTNAGSWTKFGFPGNPSSGSNTNVAGTYVGLFADSTNGVGLGNAGYISLTASTKGSYTGKLSLQGKNYSFSGKFVATNSQATSLVHLSANTTLTLALSADLAGDQIQGSLSQNNGWAVQVQADRLVYSSRRPAVATNYILVIAPDTNSVVSPAGYGVASVKVTTAGKVSVSGSLADGTKFSQSTQLSKDSYLPLYASLYSGKGLVLSWLQASPLAGGTGLSGQVAWLKKQGASLTSYPFGFTNLVDAQSSLYSGSSKVPVLTLTQGQVVLGSANAAASNSLKSLFLLDERSHATSSTNKLKLSFTLSTGLFSGSINTPSFGKVTFQGAVLQNTNLGLGYFIQNAQSGPVEISVVR